MIPRAYVQAWSMKAPWPDLRQVDAINAFERVWTELIARIDGEAWKLSDTVVAELRQRRYPNLLAYPGTGLSRGIA